MNLASPCKPHPASRRERAPGKIISKAPPSPHGRGRVRG